jgi:hypothetical protein
MMSLPAHARLLSLLIFGLWAPLASAEDIWVVAAQNLRFSTSLTRTETANLFLGLGNANPGLQPYDQRDPDLRERFYREVAGLSLASVRAHRAKQVFTGRGLPPTMLSAEEVEKTLREKANVVTYVPAGRLPAGSKVLLILESGEPK